MKQPYPVRQPPAPRAAQHGKSAAQSQASPRPRLPHEHDEASDSQASASAQQRDVGRKAYANATDGSTDTDRGPVVDEVYNHKIAPDRSSGPPRR